MTLRARLAGLFAMSEAEYRAMNEQRLQYALSAGAAIAFVPRMLESVDIPPLPKLQLTLIV